MVLKRTGMSKARFNKLVTQASTYYDKHLVKINEISKMFEQMGYDHFFITPEVGNRNMPMLLAYEGHNWYLDDIAINLIFSGLSEDELVKALFKNASEL